MIETAIRATESVAALRREFAKRGWYERPTGRIALELAFNLFLALSGIIAFLAADDLLIRGAAMLVSTAGSMGVGTGAHTASHYAASRKRWVNELLTYFGHPFFLGLSATFWRYKHLSLHHSAPNIVGIDEDSDFYPWFALTRDEVNQARGLRRFYYERLQWALLPFALVLNGLNMQRAGWAYVLNAFRPSRPGSRALRKDLAALILYFTAWVAGPCLFFPITHVLIFYVIRIGLIGYAMFAVFAPGHFPPEAARIRGDQRCSDHYLLQALSTVNFRAGFFGSLICSGLQYQIEHHLFPGVSHIHYSKMSKLVEQFCREQGLPYRSYGWLEVLWKSLVVFWVPQPVMSDVEALRERPMSE
ncbi:MAG TPA: acyl-CoA desaturase [Blastocatellia bacterium]|nr:acyl-CoA desaturase [Blastocatellia bacterium]